MKIDSGAYITAPDFPQFVIKFVFVDAIFVNAGPKSRTVIAVCPHPLNIFVILVTDDVLNKFPKSKLVNAPFPQL